MATYAELAAIKSQSSWAAFQVKVRFACVKKATALIDQATPTAQEVSWATDCLSNPVKVSEQIENYVVAANSGAAVAAILGANDSAIQSNVDAAVDKIAV